MSATTRTPNRLIHEKSPYLLQHAHNPVDWHPWGEQAFRKAQEENKPIFLSIGYSTCHWCHVMERESFEDAEVAEALNTRFVAVKVDREERPDIDQVYMEVCQALTGQGGWPLTVLLTPEKTPFFAGTYFPKRSRGGRLGLLDLLERVGRGWESDSEAFRQAGREIAESLRARRTGRPEKATALDAGTLERAYQHFVATFDPDYGGFGPAPKFPLPHQLVFLLRHAHLTGERRAREMAEKTLDAMYRGGLWDHIGFGFARYSTDRQWLVPHFEKMLYDNALLALAYLEAYQMTRDRRWAQVAEEIFAYVLRDTTSPGGGFYSAEDADSEGVEGKFYVWAPAEVEEVLGEETGRLYCRAYGITPQGNFEGRSIPNLIDRDLSALAKEAGLGPKELRLRLEEARSRLFAARERRVHPHKDDKILTAWNGLMIAALARGAAVLDRREYAEAAERATGFVEATLRRADGRLLARWRDGDADHLAYLDDYAFLSWGRLELYQATFEPAHLSAALSLVCEAQALFSDEADGGFFFTGRDAEELLARPKEAYDGALPAGNSVAALLLQRLSRLTGDHSLAELAQRQLEAFAADIQRYPAGHTLFLQALQWALGPTTEVVVSGSRDDAETKRMLDLLRRRYLPLTVALYHPTGPAGEEIEKLSPFVRKQAALDGRPTAYVCRDYACRAPVHSTEALRAELDGET